MPKKGALAPLALALGEVLQPSVAPGGLDHPVPISRIPFRPKDAPTWLPNGIDGTTEARTDRNPDCKRCALHRGVETVCMPSIGIAGLPSPLLVLGTPTARDDGAGGMVQAGANALALDEAKKHGVYRVTWGVRCAAGIAASEETLVACRPFLVGEMAGAPRVICFGPLAAQAVLGVAIDARRVARARAVVRGVHVFVVGEPAYSARNRFYKRQFAKDVAWAMTAPLDVVTDGEVEIFLEPERAVAWLEDVAAHPDLPMTVDTEHWPKSPWTAGEFRLLAIGLCRDVRAPKVIPESILAVPAVRAALKRVLEDPRVPKVNQAIKHDRHVIWRALGIDILGVEWDTLIAAKLLDSDAPAGLGSLNWKTGWGGYKELGQDGADDEDE